MAKKKEFVPGGHPVRRGDWAEAQFLARATTYGLHVSMPWDSTSRYDFLVDHDGKISRVQVKSRSYRNRWGAYVCGLSAPNSLKGYTAEEIDFIAVYLVPEDLWYVIPVAEIEGRTGIALHPQEKKSRYYRYEEAWRLLRGSENPELNREAKPAGRQPVMRRGLGTAINRRTKPPQAARCPVK